MEQSDIKSCLTFLGETFAIAKTLSLNIFIGVEIQNHRHWCSNVRKLQDEFMLGGLHFRERDSWLDYGQLMYHPAEVVKVERDYSCESVKTEPGVVLSDLILDTPSISDRASVKDSTPPLLSSSECSSNHFDSHDNALPLPSACESASVKISPTVTLPVVSVTAKNCLDEQGQKSEQVVQSSNFSKFLTKAYQPSVVLPRLNLNDSKMKGNSCVKSQTDASSETKPIENISVIHIRCRQCDEVFKSTKMRLLHYRTVHCICKICGEQFSSVLACRKHELAHETLKIPPCHKCGKTFTNASCREIHVQRNCADIFTGTDGLPIRPCVKCGLMFNNQEERKAHMKDIHLKCHQCGIICRDGTALMRHIEAVHFKLKPYKCLKCESSFTQKSALLSHEKVIHQGTKSMVCPLCGKALVSGQLNTHIKRDHMRQRDHACDLCPRKFYSASELKMHVNARHLKIKAYSCNLCDKSFTDSSNLLIHKRFVHSDLKPFQCLTCGKSYKSKAHLHRHQQIHVSL